MSENNHEFKPIETHWRGCRFRSRLEARWAVVFEALCIDWEYEPEGFVLDDGSQYLPDFLLHGLEGRCEGDLYIEVKGKMTERDLKKIEEFSKHRPIYIVTDIPWAGFNRKKKGERPDPWWLEMDKRANDWPYPYNFSYVIGDGWPAYLGVNLRGRPELFAPNNAHDAHDWVMKAAFCAAKTARFEHGEQPDDADGFDVAQECVRALRCPDDFE